MFENFLRARADQHENAETLFQRVLAQGSDPTPQEDFARARLERAAAAGDGHAHALFNLSQLYEQGVGGWNPESGRRPVLSRWRRAFYHGFFLIEEFPMFKKFFSFFRRPAPPTAESVAEEWFQRGLAFLRGDGAELDYGRARQCWQRAAEAGHGEALVQLGLLYHNGTGVWSDPERARDYWQRGADLGHAGCQDLLRRFS